MRHETEDWDPEVEGLKRCEVQWVGSAIKDIRWKERGRDEEYEDFIVSSWFWVWSSWPGDLLCSVLLRVLLHSLWPICQMASLCCFMCAYGPARVWPNDNCTVVWYYYYFTWKYLHFQPSCASLGSIKLLQESDWCCFNYRMICWNPASGICVSRLQIELDATYFFILFAVTTVSFWRVLFSVESQLR